MALKIPARQLVRSVPFTAQKTYVAEVVADSATLSVLFDISIVTTDPNQMGPSSVGFAGLPTVGPTLDALVFSNVIGTLDVLVAVDTGGTLVSILPAPIPIAAFAPVQINGLRVPGRYIELLYTNTSGGPASTDFGGYMRSN